MLKLLHKSITEELKLTYIYMKMYVVIKWKVFRELTTILLQLSP